MHTLLSTMTTTVLINTMILQLRSSKLITRNVTDVYFDDGLGCGLLLWSRSATQIPPGALQNRLFDNLRHVTAAG